MFQLGLHLDNITVCKKSIIITDFTARVRTRAYGYGDKVSVQTVTNALAAISKTCQLVGKPSPIFEREGEYILPIKRLVEGFKRVDPPAILQMAVPVSVPEMALELAYEMSSLQKQAAGDLVTIDFYFLLRSGEYTKPRKIKRNGKMVRATRTVQFRVCDVGFWKDGRILSRNSPMEVLLTADAATMKISNQKMAELAKLCTMKLQEKKERLQHLLEEYITFSVIREVIKKSSAKSSRTAHGFLFRALKLSQQYVLRQRL